MRKIFFQLMLALLFPLSAFSGFGYVYQAECKDSQQVQGDLSHGNIQSKVSKISCDSVVLTFHDNGNIMVMFADKNGKMSPLGFGGNNWDYQYNPNFVTLKSDRIYLPHSTNISNAQPISGIDAMCFFDGKLNMRKLAEVHCAGKVEIGDQRFIYAVHATIKSTGEILPW